MTAEQKKLYAKMVSHLPKTSRFYDEDCAALRRAVVRKSSAEVREAAARWDAISHVSRAECARHCQF